MVDLAELDGCTDPDTYPLLRELAMGVPADQAIVEIGTYRGKSACYLADGAAAGNGAHVWTVDPHDLPGTGIQRRVAISRLWIIRVLLFGRLRSSRSLCRVTPIGSL